MSIGRLSLARQLLYYRNMYTARRGFGAPSIEKNFSDTIEEQLALSPNLAAKIAAECGFQIVDEAELPARQPRYQPVPNALGAEVRALLRVKHRNGLYAHQAKAIAAALDGEDVCLATSTASGKSLAFMAIAADRLRREPTAKVLALYPARALIQDQREKWQEWLKPLKIALCSIDGSVACAARSELVRSSQVVLMTPDVAHAWLMSNLSQPAIADFTRNLRLLILDEMHVYDGVFGTNMAYLLRRLQAATGPLQIISSTATVGQPAAFVEQLTGHVPQVVGAEEDGSPAPSRTVMLVDGARSGGFEKTANLLRSLANTHRGRFLAFGDSRHMVERLVAASARSVEDDSTDGDDELDSDMGDEKAGRVLSSCRILPYRAGYESDDRREIQRALSDGTLAGVVSTSALELGIDIGEIDLVVLLNVPPTAKAFWQRLGRTGRRHTGACVLIDTRGKLLEKPGQLESYLRKAPEPSWLYLDNRYLQYTNALCAAFELRAQGRPEADAAAFKSLPLTFSQLLDNELNPSEVLPPDLYPLRQRAEAGPHREFPLRSGTEQSFQVKGPHGRPLGSVTMSQVLREAYPGAIYYYMARPYRTYRLNARRGEILARRERHWTTRPIAQAMVFPRFQGGTLGLWRSEGGFVAEAEAQVSERVLGFVEQRGSVKEEHRYGPTSPFHDRELTRFFDTTGVCWYFAEPVVLSDAAALEILEAYCAELGVQSRDLGVGRFHSKTSPVGAGKCQGLCIFDATNGSLRLTQRLAERFADIVEAAIAAATNDGALDLAAELAGVAAAARVLRQAIVGRSPFNSPAKDNRAEVIAAGQNAIFRGQSDVRQVQVLGYRYTPHGLMYELAHQQPGVKWMVAATQVEPLYGETAMVRSI